MTMRSPLHSFVVNNDNDFERMITVGDRDNDDHTTPGSTMILGRPLLLLLQPPRHWL